MLKVSEDGRGVSGFAHSLSALIGAEFRDNLDALRVDRRLGLAIERVLIVVVAPFFDCFAC